MQVTFFNAQRPSPKARRQHKTVNSVFSFPKKLADRQCCPSPNSFNMRMLRTKAVAEKKSCSFRQRFLNKTTLHEGWIVAACHNIYTPWASAQCKRRLVQKGYWTHQGTAFTSQRKSLSPFSDKVPVGILLRITSSQFLSFYLRGSLTKYFHLYEVTISPSYWMLHRILLGATHCFEQCCIGVDVFWSGRNKFQLTQRSKNVHNIQIHLKKKKKVEKRMKIICFPHFFGG